MMIYHHFQTFLPCFLDLVLLSNLAITCTCIWPTLRLVSRFPFKSVSYKLLKPRKFFLLFLKFHLDLVCTRSRSRKVSRTLQIYRPILKIAYTYNLNNLELTSNVHSFVFQPFLSQCASASEGFIVHDCCVSSVR
jgi:hypothetical protein